MVLSSGYLVVVDANGNTNNLKGTIWSARVDDSGFVGSGGTHGQWGWAQIIHTANTRTVAGGTQVLEYGSAAAGWYTEGIDAGYPLPAPGSTDAYFQADGSLNEDSDPPGSALDATIETAHARRDDFTDWLMYVPPGTGSQPVPLARFTWFWQGSATYNSPSWSGSGLSQGHGAVDLNPSFPDWSHLVQPGTYRWRNQ